MQPFSEEQIEVLVTLLPVLAEKTSCGLTELDSTLIKRMLDAARIRYQEWIEAAVRQVGEILVRAVNGSTSLGSDEVNELEGLGFSYATAFLAVDSAMKGSSGGSQPATPTAGNSMLSVSPASINFGLLPPDRGAEATLRIEGQLVHALTPDPRILLNIAKSRDQLYTVRVLLRPGSANERLSVSLVLVGQQEQVLVPIVAGWGKPSHRQRAHSPDPPKLQTCPICGHRSLFWNRFDNKLECLNPHCKAEGPDINRIRRPR